MNHSFVPRRAQAYDHTTTSVKDDPILDAWLLHQVDLGSSQSLGLLLFPRAGQFHGGLLCVSLRPNMEAAPPQEWPLDRATQAVSLALSDALFDQWASGQVVDIDDTSTDPQGRTLFMQVCQGVPSDEGKVIHASIVGVLCTQLGASLDVCDAQGTPAWAYAQALRESIGDNEAAGMLGRLVDHHVLTQMMEASPQGVHAAKKPRI